MSKYVALMETSEEEFESWIYFIKLNGNENALTYLRNQLEQVNWRIYEGLSTFDLDMDHPVSEITAKEMTKVELNVYLHRKFDGSLKQINFGFKETDNNKKKIKRVFSKLGYGQIDEYISDEDVSENEDDEKRDTNDNNSTYTVSSTDDSEQDSSITENEEDEEEEEEEEEVVVEESKKKTGTVKLPNSLQQQNPPQQFVKSGGKKTKK